MKVIQVGVVGLTLGVGVGCRQVGLVPEPVGHLDPASPDIGGHVVRHPPSLQSTELAQQV